MFPGSQNMISGGTFINQNLTSRGMDILMEWVATGAFHNSKELYDAPKYHPHTRVAVLDDIMKWANESKPVQDDFMLWLFGPAGAGKSAIAKRIAEIAAEEDLLIADFFFSKSSPTRNTTDRLIATLAYQLALSIPDTRSYIEDAIDRDRAIFNKNILTQLDTLLIKPFQSVSSTQNFPAKKLIIIDGLDECKGSTAQVAILEAISRSITQHKLPIIFLVVSRSEPDIVTSFNCNEPLRSIHRRLALDDSYRPDDDIRLFFSERFDHIKRTHPLRLTIPISWPSQIILDRLVKKSSGQFIYASTVVKFVESSRHRPSARLNIILGILPPGKANPFAELDALYNHILSSVDDIQLTLRVLSLYVMTPNFAFILHHLVSDMSPEHILSLEPGDIHLSLADLSSIVTYDESSGAVKVLHASLVDFLSDKHRSTTFYIDMASTCTDFVCHVLQYVKGPDGIQAGNIHLFREAILGMFHWIPKGQLRSVILNFDLDAFINASIRRYYGWSSFDSYLIPGSVIETFKIWMGCLNDAGLEDRDKQEALCRLNKSFESRLQIYQSDWRLKILLTLAVPDFQPDRHWGYCGVPSCRCLDILLEMDDHNIHLVDRDALDLRHAYRLYEPRLIDRYVDGNAYASAALHCMRFLSSPPNYSENNECPEMGLIYAEWKATCGMTLDMLCILLQQADTSPELMQFIGNHDIHLEIQKNFHATRIWKVDVHILAFLSRASLCPDWRIISTIQRSLIIARNNQRPCNYTRSDDQVWGSFQDYGGRKATLHGLIRQPLDQCCSNVHYNYV